MDDADIQRIVDTFLVDVKTIAAVPGDVRPDAVYRIAFGFGQLAGLTDAGSKDLAERVRRNVEWALYERKRESSL